MAAEVLSHAREHRVQLALRQGVAEDQPSGEGVVVKSPTLQDWIALLHKIGCPLRLAFEDEQLRKIDREEDELVMK